MATNTAAALEESWSRWSLGFAAFMAHLDRAKVQYLSHSKASSVQYCPRCYYRQYVLGVDPESTALLLARLFHEAASALYGCDANSSAAQLFERLNTSAVGAAEKIKLQNAVILLCENRWSGLEVVTVEKPFFLDLAGDLPPIIGIADLVLRQGQEVTVIDHKTSINFTAHDPGQLVLYAEHARRQHRSPCVRGYFDEYRFVPNLATIRKPAFRRTEAEVGRSLLTPMIERYRQAWGDMRRCDARAEPRPRADCWSCKR